MKNFFNKFLFFLLSITTFVSVFVIGYSIYYYFNDKTTTIASAYAGVLTYSEEGYFPIEINYYSNKANNGLEVFETNFNYYTDSEIPDTAGEYKNIYSSGIQLFGKNSFKEHIVDNGLSLSLYREMQINNAYYYNSTNGVSYTSISKINDMDKWILDFNGQLAFIEEKGVKLIQSYDFLWWTYGHEYFIYDINLLIRDLYNSVQSLDNGLYILQFDLTKYFNFSVLEDKHFVDKSGDINFTMVNIKINKSVNGMLDSSQSLFHSVKGQNDWAELDSNNEYFGSFTNYYLNVSDLSFIEYEDNYLAKLKTNAIDFLNDFSELNIVLNINLDSQYLFLNDIVLVGFDTSPFGNLNISKIILNSETEQEFLIFDNFDNSIFELNNITLVQGGSDA